MWGGNANKKILATFSVFILLICLAVGVQAGYIGRSLNQSEVLPNSHLNVTLDIFIDNELFYVIDEIYPTGWTVVDKGVFSNAEAGHMKYVEMSASQNESLSYILKSPNQFGTHYFTGEYGMQGANITNMSGTGSVDVVSVLDKSPSTYYPQNNTCVTNKNNFRIITYNCKAQDIDGRDITQYVAFEWNGGVALDTNWVFAYDNNLTSGSLYYWKNQSYLVNESYLTNGTANITVYDVQSYVDAGTPSASLCEVGNEWNNLAYNVTFLSGNSTIYCFNQQGQINSTTYWLQGTYDKTNTQEVTRYIMKWSDITNQVNYAGYNLLNNGMNYYYVKQAVFQPNERIDTKWVFTPKNTSKNGKWHIFGWKAGQNLFQSINNNEFIYQDPFWNKTWSNFVTFDVNTSVPKTNIQIAMNISYDSDMNSDFSDLRFLNNCSDDAVELYAWNDTQANGHSIKVWLNLSTWGTNHTYCMYYGNPTATATWDGNRTFAFFEDFENYADNSDLAGQGGWTGTTNPYIKIDEEPDAYEGGKYLLFTDSPSLDYDVIHDLPSGLENVIYGIKGKSNGSQCYNTIGLLENSTALSRMGFRASFTVGFLISGGWTYPDYYAEDTWYHWNMTWINTTLSTMCWNSTCGTNTMFGSGTPNKIRIWNVQDGSLDSSRFDAVHVANTSYPVPTYLFGSEENVDSTPPNVTIVEPQNNSNFTTTAIPLNFEVFGVTTIDDIFMFNFSDGFENYTVNQDLVGQGNWEQVGASPYGNIHVVNSTSFTGSNSIYCPDVPVAEYTRLPLYKNLSSGFVQFAMMVNGTDPNGQVYDLDSNGLAIHIMRFEAGYIQTRHDSGWVTVMPYAQNEWYELNFTWINTTHVTFCAWNSTQTSCSSGLNFLSNVGAIYYISIVIDNTASSDSHHHYDNFIWSDTIKVVNPPEHCWYSLNGGTNTSLPQCVNTTITAIDGQNNLILYANDTHDNIGASSTVYFTVSLLSLGNISVPSPVDPLESTTVPVNALSIATSGIFDTGLCYLYYPNSTLKEQNIAQETVINASSTNLNCTFTMQYYETNGTYNVTIIGNDTGANSDQTDTTFVYNQLDAFQLNTSTLNFGTIYVGQSGVSSFRANNTGNVALNLEMIGTNLTGSSQSIDVSQMKFDDDSDPSDGTVMTTSYQSFTALPVSAEKSGYIQLTIPSALLPDTYTGNVTIRS